MKVEKSSASYAPSSALGIMRFFDTGGGPKISPEIVFALIAIFGIAILLLQKI